jgi:N-6 DNA Methylase/Eco57I restriction-modification methylase
MANLQKQLATLAKMAGEVNSEATLRQYFIQALDEYVKSQNLFAIESGPLFRLEEPIVRGRSDAKIGGITFEVKLPKPHGKGIDAAVKQVRGYIEEYATKGISVRGVAYDGLSLALLDEQRAIVFKGDVSQGAHLLAAWLVLLASAARTPEDMVDRFGSASAISQQTIKTLFELFIKYEPAIPFISEVFAIWKEVYGCAANINTETVQSLRRTAKDLDIAVRNKKDAERFVFVTETYLSILLKVLVARVAAEQKLIPQKSVVELICQPRGKEHIRYTELGTVVPHLLNVFEEDPFEWFIDAARADLDAEAKVRAVLSCIVESIDNIELLKMGQDFLRIFYQSFFDSASRRALGEFYTNDKLVAETLDAIGYEGDPKKKIIDFACGSGSFLVQVLNRVKSRTKGRAAASVLSDVEAHIFGVDIHPLAVAMARVNYLIAVAPLLSPKRSFTVPIYWADSLVRLSVKETSRNWLGEAIKISIPGMRRFRLPDPTKFDWEQLFGFLRNHIARYSGKVELAAVWKRFEQEFSKEKVLPFEHALRDFIKQIVDRHNEGRDTRWLPMLRNILFLERQRGEFDYVVGNPPWVRIHNIDEELRKRISEDYIYCAKAGWKYGSTISGSKSGFGKQLDLCVPFVERALELLKSGGRFSLILTSKVQQALYANELRRNLISEKQLLRISDYSLFPIALFKDAVNYPLVLSVENIAPSAESVCRVVIVNSEQKILTYDTPQVDMPLLAHDKESPWMMAPPDVTAVFRKMQRNSQILGELPATRPKMGVKTGANGTFIVTDIQRTERPNEVVVITEAEEHVRLERDVLRPLVRGRDVRAWGYAHPHSIIWTHDDNGEVLTELPPRAAEYFADDGRRKLLEDREDFKTGMPVWTIFRVSADKLSRKIAWKKYGTQMQSTVLEAKCDLDGTARLVVPLQTVYLIPIEDDDRAYFLSALFNSLAFRALLMSFSVRASGAFFHYTAWIVGLGVSPVTKQQLKTDWRSFAGQLMAPEIETKMVELSRALHANPDAITARKLESSVDLVAAKAYGIADGEFKTLTDYYEFMRPPEINELLEEDEVEE